MQNKLERKEEERDRHKNQLETCISDKYDVQTKVDIIKEELNIQEQKKTEYEDEMNDLEMEKIGIIN